MYVCMYVCMSFSFSLEQKSVLSASVLSPQALSLSLSLCLSLSLPLCLALSLSHFPSISLALLIPQSLLRTNIDKYVPSAKEQSPPAEKDIHT